jgi:hypothetical protein
VRARLIRTPLRATGAPPPPTPRSWQGSRATWGELRPELRFSAGGYRLLCREVDGHVVAFRTPSQPDAWRKPRRVQLWSSDRDLFALGWAHRNVVILRRNAKGGAELEGGRFRHTWPGPELPLPHQPFELVATRGISPVSGAMVDIVWFRDTERRLWCWRIGEVPIPTRGGLAVGRRDGREVVVVTAEGRTRITRGNPGGPPVQVEVPFPAVEAHVGSGGGPGIGTVLLELGDGRLAFAPRHEADKPSVHPRIHGATVVGAWGDWRARGVVCLRRDLLYWQSLEPAAEPVLLPARDAVVAAACSPLHYSRLVAWMETSGRIVFHDLERGELQILDRETSG